MTTNKTHENCVIEAAVTAVAVMRSMRHSHGPTSTDAATFEKKRKPAEGDTDSVQRAITDNGHDTCNHDFHVAMSSGTVMGQQIWDGSGWQVCPIATAIAHASRTADAATFEKKVWADPW